MIKITRRFTFSAGHRLGLHEGACNQFHGHNYVLEVTVARLDGSVNSRGMVADFHDISALIEKWLKDNWDHSTILSDADEEALGALTPNYKVCRTAGEPTAENMAFVLFYEVIPELLSQISKGALRVLEVVLWENEKSKATVNDEQLRAK